MGSRSIKVAIVGGGPAGLLSAILLARKGCEVTLIERGSWPMDKVCGEGIMPTGVEILQRHGLLERLDSSWVRPFLGVRYVGQNGRHAHGEFRGRSGLAVRRLALSETLYEAALEDPRIELIPSCSLVGFEECASEVSIEAKDLNSGRTLHIGGFDYLVGADGLKSKLRRLAGMDGRRPGCQPRRMGARAHYRVQPWDNKVQVWWSAGIEAYVTPTSSSCVEIAFGWDQDQVRPRHDSPGVSFEQSLLSYFPELKRRVQGREKLSALRSWGPLAHCARTPLEGRIALIGDAGLFYDQITGEGLSMAFAQSELLAESISEWHSAAGRRRFVHSIRGLSKHYIRITGMAMFFTRHERLRSLKLLLLSKFPSLFAHLLHVNMGDVALLNLPLGGMLRDVLAGSPQGALTYSIPSSAGTGVAEGRRETIGVATAP